MLACISCTKNTNKEIKILKLPETGEEVLKTSTFADTIIYVPLETTQESLIDNIESLWINDSIILILHSKGLLKFDINGKFIQQIGTRGRGPGEYERTLNFTVVNDTIYLSPTERSGFLRYTLDGTFCGFVESQLSCHPLCFNSTVDKKLAIYNNYEGKVYVYNENIYVPPDSITIEYEVSELRRIRSNLGEPPLITFFQKTLSGLLFTNYLNDTVWNITGDKKEPAFIFETKDKLLPWDKQIEYFSMDDTPKWMEIAKSYYFLNLVPVANSMFVFQNAWFHDDYLDKNLYPYFYQEVHFGNAQTGEFRKYDYIYDDITGNQKLTWFYHIYSKDYLIGEIHPYDLSNNSSQDKNANSEAWLNQMKNIKEDDNPILVFVKVKKNL